MSVEDESIFVGNVGMNVSGQTLKELFEEHGATVRNVDLKTGFGFVFCHPADPETGLDGILKKIHGTSLDGKLITVERSRGTSKLRENRRRETLVPTHTLFVVGFDPDRVKEADINEIFRDYGTIVKIELKRTYTFVSFAEIDQATAALEACNNKEYFGKTLFIEYSSNRPREAFSGRPRESSHDGRGRHHHHDNYDRHSSSSSSPRQPTYAELQEELQRRRYMDEQLFGRISRSGGGGGRDDLYNYPPYNSYPPVQHLPPGGGLVVASSLPMDAGYDREYYRDRDGGRGGGNGESSRGSHRERSSAYPAPPLAAGYPGYPPVDSAGYPYYPPPAPAASPVQYYSRPEVIERGGRPAPGHHSRGGDDRDRHPRDKEREYPPRYVSRGEGGGERYRDDRYASSGYRGGGTGALPSRDDHYQSTGGGRRSAPSPSPSPPSSRYRRGRSGSSRRDNNTDSPSHSPHRMRSRSRSR